MNGEYSPDTIFALASASGRAGIAVFRISGPRAEDLFQRLCRCTVPDPWHAIRVRLHDPMTGAEIDDGLALWFAAPRSFTGEDVVELSLHGGRANIAAILDLLSKFPGYRLAEPGEFTKRAFLNEKFDLTAAEGLADLVDAETEAQRRQARRQMAGDLGRLYEGWRGRLLRALAHIEAEIDFVEEDLPADVTSRLKAEISYLIKGIDSHLADRHRGERLREGVSIAIIGAPNVGKSSLLNALAKRDVAIVAARAGTTRDVIEVHLDLGGYPVILADTAGLRESADDIEAEGIRRARARAQEADLKLALFDGTASVMDQQTYDIIDENTIVVISKWDLDVAKQPPDLVGLPVSAKTGAGMQELLNCMENEVSKRFDMSFAPIITRIRHRTALIECRDALNRALTLNNGHLELLAEDLRLAARALGRITGRVGVEDMLDIIFQEFCIGK